MPTELLSVTEAAKAFLEKSGHVFVRLEKTDLDRAKNEWVLTFDVGITSTKLKKVHVNVETGKVVAVE